jgi:hypothetical protein
MKWLVAQSVLCFQSVNMLDCNIGYSNSISKSHRHAFSILTKAVEGSYFSARSWECCEQETTSAPNKGQAPELQTP